MISVIMSVFNEKKVFLVEAIESILNQTFRDFEFIIFDDNSNYETSCILKEYENKDPRIKLITNTKNMGLTYNLNYGIKIAKGKYICRQDSDDISLPKRLEIEYQFMEEHKEIGVAGTSFFTLKKGKYIKNKCSRKLLNPDYVKTNLFFRNIIMHGSVIIRKEMLDLHNLNYDICFKKSQDFEFWNRICVYSRIVIIPIRLCIYRKHDNQISSLNSTREEQKKYCENILIRQLDILFEGVDTNKKLLHLGLINFNPELKYKDIKIWCKCLKNKNSSLLIYNKKFFNKLVNWFRFRFLVKKIYRRIY